MIIPAARWEVVVYACDEHGARQRRAYAVLNIVLIAAASTRTYHLMEAGLGQGEIAPIIGQHRANAIKSVIHDHEKIEELKEKTISY